MLLGRRSSDRAYDRNALRFVEGRAVAWNALCDTPSGKRRGDRLAAVLQLPEAALDVGISQPDGLRDKVACRQREARRVIAQLWETPNAGKVNDAAQVRPASGLIGEVCIEPPHFIRRPPHGAIQEMA